MVSYLPTPILYQACVQCANISNENLELVHAVRASCYDADPWAAYSLIASALLAVVAAAVAVVIVGVVVVLVVVCVLECEHVCLRVGVGSCVISGCGNGLCRAVQCSTVLPSVICKLCYGSVHDLTIGYSVGSKTLWILLEKVTCNMVSTLHMQYVVSLKIS